MRCHVCQRGASACQLSLCICTPLQDLDSLALPATYVALLSLSADETAGLDHAAVQAELEQCAQQAGDAPVPSILQSEPFAMSRTPRRHCTAVRFDFNCKGVDEASAACNPCRRRFGCAPLVRCSCGSRKGPGYAGDAARGAAARLLQPVLRWGTEAYGALSS